MAPYETGNYRAKLVDLLVPFTLLAIIVLTGLTTLGGGSPTQHCKTHDRGEDTNNNDATASEELVWNAALQKCCRRSDASYLVEQYGGFGSSNGGSATHVCTR